VIGVGARPFWTAKPTEPMGCVGCRWTTILCPAGRSQPRLTSSWIEAGAARASALAAARSASGALVAEAITDAAKAIAAARPASTLSDCTTATGPVLPLRWKSRRGGRG